MKHGVSFSDALEAFADPSRMIAPDTLHSTIEERFFAVLFYVMIALSLKEYAKYGVFAFSI